MDQLTGNQYKQFQEALLSAFPARPALAQMVQFGLGISLDAISMGDNLAQIVFQLIQWSQAQGNLAQLMAAARDAAPKNTRLLVFAEQFALAPATPPRTELEQIIQKTNSFLDVEKWRTRLGEIEPTICRVEVKTNKGMIYGTGFLLGSDAVMTNYHVVEAVILGEKGGSTGTGLSAQPSDVVLRFDYKRLADGTTLNPGTEYRLPAQNWLIDSSPIEQLDYALLRVSDAPGDSQMGTQKGSSDAPPRGFLIPATNYAIQPHTPLFIVQHPQGDPLQLALDTDAIISVDPTGTRVRYRTNTLPGSSGSPCFNSNWELVVLHHAGDPNFNPTFNEGIPFTAIMAQLQQNNKLSALGKQEP